MIRLPGLLRNSVSIIPGYRITALIFRTILTEGIISLMDLSELLSSVHTNLRTNPSNGMQSKSLSFNFIPNTEQRREKVA